MTIHFTIRTCLLIAAAVCFGIRAFKGAAGTKLDLDAAGKCLVVAAFCFH